MEKKFTEFHEWVVKEGDVVTIGITKNAQKELGEIVYVELPRVGLHIKKGDEVVILESTKAAVDIYAPVSGLILEVNSELAKSTDKLNFDPEETGWLLKLRLSDQEEFTSLKKLEI